MEHIRDWSPAEFDLGQLQAPEQKTDRTKPETEHADFWYLTDKGEIFPCWYLGESCQDLRTEVIRYKVSFRDGRIMTVYGKDLYREKSDAERIRDIRRMHHHG